MLGWVLSTKPEQSQNCQGALRNCRGDGLKVAEVALVFAL